MQTPLPNLLGMPRENLVEFFTSLDERPFRATQVVKWIHQQKVCEFEQMTNLSKPLRERLGNLAIVDVPELRGHQISNDGTQKWLVGTDSDNSIETVFIPELERATLCVSSQVGCALNCRFCATATQGFTRNLTAAEIIGQLWLASSFLEKNRGQSITNIVMMGMGEPLLNFENVVAAMQLMLEDNAYGLAKRRITLSTAGMVPGIKRLKQTCPVSLAVSLHAPNDSLRDEIVPLNKTYPISTLLEACRNYVEASPKDKITFEYVMLDGINDSPHMARQLAKLLSDVPSKINLIPFNSFPNTSFQCSPTKVINTFRNILMDAGLITITRKTRGEDIDAACGQLAGQVVPRARRVALRRGFSEGWPHSSKKSTSYDAVEHK